MKPTVICHMVSSIDGRLAPSHWTTGPDGTRDGWSAAYAAVHETLEGDAWIVGRVTMADCQGAAASAQSHWQCRQAIPLCGRASPPLSAG